MAANFMLNLHKQHYGFSIVELLVAMGLSLILLAGVATMFASSRGAYETNDRLARIEENGRFALDTMARDIRSAGYSGCSSQANTHLIVNSPGGIFDNLGNIPVQGFNFASAGTWAPVLPGFIAGNNPSPVDGSDILLISGPTAVAPVALTAPMTSDIDDMIIAPAGGTGLFHKGQLLMIGDCQDRTYFEVTGYTPGTGKIQHNSGPGGSGYYGNRIYTPLVGAPVPNSIVMAYGSVSPAGDPTNSESGPAQIFGVQTEFFYIGPASGSKPGNQYNSLYRQIVGNLGADELIEGVDSMQLLYGLNTLGGTASDGSLVVDTYANVAPDPKKIVNVTISLLIRSLDEYGTLANMQTYYLLGQADPTANFPPTGDRRQRQVFSTTIWVRNPPN